jgi:hypothetical protein
MAQYHPEIAAYYAEKHLTLAERNEAYAAAVRFANDRGVSHKHFLAAEYAGRVTMKGIYVPTTEDQVIPKHISESNVESHDEGCRTDGCYNAPCDGSFAKTMTGRCQTCGELLDVLPADPEIREALAFSLQD